MMHEEPTAIRQRVLEHVEMLASASVQLAYERDVPIACVPDELVSIFADDLFHPKWQPFLDAFTELELKSLAELYGRLCVAVDAFDRSSALTVGTVLKMPEWRAVMSYAKDLTVELKRNG